MLSKASIQPLHHPVTRLTVVKKNIRFREPVDGLAAYLFWKRIADILFAALFLVFVMSWLTPLLMLLITLDSGGEVFFVQRRTGRGGRSFSCFKFRTMSGHAGRITRFGHFLRKSNIDEFPQFWNILMGSMTLIGPRPHMQADCNRFAQVLNNYKFRNMVKPGLTGLAQVKGFHGTITDKYGIVMRFHWDQYYIRNMSALLDIKIFLLTIGQRFSSVFDLIFVLKRGEATSN